MEASNDHGAEREQYFERARDVAGSLDDLVFQTWFGGRFGHFLALLLTTFFSCSNKKLCSVE